MPSSYFRSARFALRFGSYAIASTVAGERHANQEVLEISDRCHFVCCSGNRLRRWYKQCRFSERQRRRGGSHRREYCFLFLWRLASVSRHHDVRKAKKPWRGSKGPSPQPGLNSWLAGRTSLPAMQVHHLESRSSNPPFAYSIELPQQTLHGAEVSWLH